MGSSLLGGCRLLLYVLWTLLLAPPQAVLLALRWPWNGWLPQIYHRGCARLLGIDLVTRGAVSGERPTLFVANHSSYLDIPVLGTLLQGSFIAKQEVAGWPLFGFLSKLQKTVFIDRRLRGSTGRQRDAMVTRLEQGDSLILFPEGTSSDGNRTLPFKTALFAVAALRVDGRPLTVQPVSVTATALDGIPLGHALRPFYAWYGDMELAPHLWNVFRLGRLTVEVEFHPPVTVAQFGSRKALAEHCWSAVADGVSCALAGRVRPPAAPGSVPEAVGA